MAGARAMTDALLMLLVLSALVLALAVDVGALVGWLRRPR
jgi:type III secretory pathway component EscS